MPSNRVHVARSHGPDRCGEHACPKAPQGARRDEDAQHGQAGDHDDPERQPLGRGAVEDPDPAVQRANARRVREEPTVLAGVPIIDEECTLDLDLVRVEEVVAPVHRIGGERADDVPCGSEGEAEDENHRRARQSIASRDRAPRTCGPHGEHTRESLASPDEDEDRKPNGHVGDANPCDRDRREDDRERDETEGRHDGRTKNDAVELRRQKRGHRHAAGKDEERSGPRVRTTDRETHDDV